MLSGNVVLVMLLALGSSHAAMFVGSTEHITEGYVGENKTLSCRLDEMISNCTWTLMGESYWEETKISCQVVKNRKGLLDQISMS